ncbi:MAG: YHS domain-containing protein [Candidatus Omnitrophica bacterium]|nr:YHS domain-containing protein [Candidatus Omnitrophota bacterium]
MGGEVIKEYSYAYEGKTYYFCCHSCIDSFKNNPEDYI